MSIFDTSDKETSMESGTGSYPSQEGQSSPDVGSVDLSSDGHSTYDELLSAMEAVSDSWFDLAPQSREYLRILLIEMPKLHLRKAAGYGQKRDTWANFREASGIGIEPWQGVLVRMGDKWSRIKNVARDPSNEQLGESLEGELIDLAAYAIIEICLLRELDVNVPACP